MGELICDAIENDLACSMKVAVAERLPLRALSIYACLTGNEKLKEKAKMGLKILIKFGTFNQSSIAS